MFVCLFCFYSRTNLLQVRVFFEQLNYEQVTEKLSYTVSLCWLKRSQKHFINIYFLTFFLFWEGEVVPIIVIEIILILIILIIIIIIIIIIFAKKVNILGKRAADIPNYISTSICDYPKVSRFHLTYPHRTQAYKLFPFRQVIN